MLLAAGFSILLILFGDARVTPWVTSASAEDGDRITQNIGGTVDLYDTSQMHSVQLEFGEDGYQDMIDMYREDNGKEYIKADLTIDGTFIDSVGIRLKGNSTLRSLAGDGSGGGAAAVWVAVWRAKAC
ncbi:hypothetical protein [Streptomyces spongiae]|uniref:hypothetical protein n=1 Tax=Streptomyces spongiae TaxID=565072 RepID=UPI001D15DE87|nr:hypothetical protein [Streptomyces spongiae]